MGEMLQSVLRRTEANLVRQFSRLAPFRVRLRHVLHFRIGCLDPRTTG